MPKPDAVGPHTRATAAHALPTLKVVLLGDLGVGKTCLRTQLVHHVFSNAYKATIGGDYLTTSVSVAADGGTRKVSLQVWDTAGQERFNLISQAFYRGADVVVLVYDVTSYESVLSVRDWFARFLEHCHVENPGVVIVGNKADRAAERCVDRDEIREVLCRHSTLPLEHHVADWSADVLETSCKQLATVERVFARVAQLGLDRAPAMQQFDAILLGAAPPQRCAC